MTPPPPIYRRHFEVPIVFVPFVSDRSCIVFLSLPTPRVVVCLRLRRSIPRQQQPVAALRFAGTEFGGMLAAVVSEAVCQQVCQEST